MLCVYHYFCFSLYSRVIISRQRTFVYFKQSKLKKNLGLFLMYRKVAKLLRRVPVCCAHRSFPGPWATVRSQHGSVVMNPSRDLVCTSSGPHMVPRCLASVPRAAVHSLSLILVWDDLDSSEECRPGILQNVPQRGCD